MSLLIESIKLEEGFRALPYNDSLGYPTIGYGRLLVKEKIPASEFNIEVTEAQAAEWLCKEVWNVQDKLAEGQHAGVWEMLHGDLSRRTALVNMAYQLGYAGTLRFFNMWAALYLEEYDDAAEAMLDSHWAEQTPNRAIRMARLMRGEMICDVYSSYPSMQVK